MVRQQRRVPTKGFFCPWNAWLLPNHEYRSLVFISMLVERPVGFGGTHSLGVSFGGGYGSPPALCMAVRVVGLSLSQEPLALGQSCSSALCPRKLGR